VGAGSLSSALAMDKIVSKILFVKAGIKTPDFYYFTRNDYRHIKKTVQQKLSFPLFIKPCSLGSSIGITKVKSEKELKPAVDSAFQNDRKIIVEQGIDAREIEISVMGNADIKISPPGELIPNNEFYNYADKYLDHKTTFIIPAKLDPEIEKKVKNTARDAYRALFLNGMSRIDFLLEKQTNQVYINEINTIPGFTEISMFPKLWQVEGISFSQLLTRLIEYGFEYHQQTRIPANQNSGQTTKTDQ
jgi:D-alanine-D-alanine ligase